MGYTPNYSHLVGIMISKTIGSLGTLFSDKPIFYHCNVLSWSVDQCNTWCMPWTSMANLAVPFRPMSNLAVTRALWSYKRLPCHIGVSHGRLDLFPLFLRMMGVNLGGQQHGTMAVLIFSWISAKGKSIRKIFGCGFHPTSTAPALLFMLLFVLHNPQGYK